MTIHYRAGDWLAVVTDTGAVLLDGDVSDDVVRDLLSVLEDGGGVPQVLQVLTGSFGTSLAAIPPFAMAVTGAAGVHIAVRGPVAVDVDGEPDAVSTEGVSTWSERTLRDVAGVVLRRTVAGAGGGRRLPVRHGVVRADALEVLEAADAPTGAGRTSEALVEPVGESVLGDAAEAAGGPVADDAPSLAEAVAVAEAPVPVRPLVPATVPVPGLPPVAADAPARMSEPAPTSALVPTEASPMTLGTAELTHVDETAAPVEVASAVDRPVGDPSKPVPAPTELDGPSYDYLWGSTIARDVEDAAVRSDDDDVPAVVRPLIDGVPASVGAPTAPEGAGPGPADAEGVPGDHDGATIMKSDFRARRAAATSPTDPSPGAPVTDGPLVLGSRCRQGHPNPPHAATCRACGEPVDGEPASVPRPPLGRAAISTGEVVELWRSVVVGRRPQAVRVQGDDVPQLVTVPSPQQDISRNHLELRLEGWHVLAVDLDSKNGTTLRRPGQSPVRLSAREATLLASGDVLDLGDGVSVALEDLP